jgi:hypothetical protein
MADIPKISDSLRSEIVLTDEQLRAIGCVAVEFTYLETSLDSVIEKLCCLDEHDFRLLTAGAQISPKLKIARDVTEARIKAEFRERHKNLFDDISHQVAQRNNVIHGHWRVPKLTGHQSNLGEKGWRELKWTRKGDPFAIRKKRGEPGHTIFKSKDLMEIARGLHRARTALLSFLRESGLSPPPFTSVSLKMD